MRVFKNVKGIEIYRYGIISPVLHGSEQHQNEYFRQLSEKGIKIPPDSGDIFYLNTSTFKRWLRLFRQQGLEGLKEKSRSDKGTFRKIPSNLLDAIASIIQEAGAVSVSDLHRKLLMAKHITHETLSYETLRQLVARHQLLSPHKNLRPGKNLKKSLSMSYGWWILSKAKAFVTAIAYNEVICVPLSMMPPVYWWGMNGG